MKVLAISSSPRKGGNSDVLCDEFLKGATQNGHTTRKIRLAEKKIAPCMVCYGCAENHACVRKNDMAEVLDAMKAADVIVLASPVFYSVCAQMKTMIDRCLADYQAIRDKTFYLIVTSADPQHRAADETLADLREYLRCLPGAKEAGVIFGTGTWDKTVVPFMTNGGWPGHVIRDMKSACPGAKFACEMQVKFDSNGGDHLETPENKIETWAQSVKALLEGE